MIWSPWIWTVSYTHLHQQRDHGLFAGGLLRGGLAHGNKTPFTTGNSGTIFQYFPGCCFFVWITILSEVNSPVSVSPAGTIPVSYTHLDVYKRQSSSKRLAHLEVSFMPITAQTSPKQNNGSSFLSLIHISLIYRYEVDWFVLKTSSTWMDWK